MCLSFFADCVQCGVCVCVYIRDRIKLYLVETTELISPTPKTNTPAHPQTFALNASRLMNVRRCRFVNGRRRRRRQPAWLRTAIFPRPTVVSVCVCMLPRRRMALCACACDMKISYIFFWFNQTGTSSLSPAPHTQHWIVYHSFGCWAGAAHRHRYHQRAIVCRSCWDPGKSRRRRRAKTVDLVTTVVMLTMSAERI